jgi:hypothetical protein
MKPRSIPLALAASLSLAASLVGAPAASASGPAGGTTNGTNLTQQFRIYYNNASCRYGTGYQLYKWDARWTRPAGATSGLYSAKAKVDQFSPSCDNSTTPHNSTGWVTFYPTFTTSTSSPWWYFQWSGWPYVVNTGSAGFGNYVGGTLVTTYYPYRQSSSTLTVSTPVTLWTSTTTP